MSLGYCIPDLIAAGRIPDSHAGELRRLYDELVNQHTPRMGRTAAEALATQQAVDAWEKGLKDARRAILAGKNAQDRLLAEARTQYRGANPDGPVDPKALVAHFAYDHRAPYSSVEYVQREVQQTSLGLMYDILAKHRADLIGRLRNPDALADMVRELHGQDSGNLNARELADAWRQTSEYLRARFNAAGGNIGKLESWGLPQSHDPLRVGSVPREQWISDVTPMLDRARMIDNQTMQPMSDARLRDLLERTYDQISSDGWIGRTPGANRGASMIANRHAEHRVLHFKDADSWMDYNGRYGLSTPWDAMMGHVHRMSRDIAMVEKLGPNPAATVRWMKDVMIKEAKERGDRAAIKAADAGVDTIDSLWSVLTGEAGRPKSERLANIGASIRQWQAATKLGGAVLSSMSDVATATLTRHYNGLAKFTQLPDMLAALNPANPLDREIARRNGIIADEFIGHVAGGGRVVLEELSGGRYAGQSTLSVEGFAARSNEVTRRMADLTLRASGLNAWTLAGREAMGKSFAANFAEQAGTRWSDLDPHFRAFFERNGMGETAWNTIRETAPDSSAGYKTIWPNTVGDEAIARRLQQAMLAEIDFAVPTTGLRTRAFLAGKGRPGTIAGELWRTLFQFKGFPIVVMMMHGARMLDQPKVWNKAMYGTMFLGGTTLMGALSLQLASIKDGKDPAQMTGDHMKDFWWRAALKGGGLGVFGDVVNATANGYGQSAQDIVAGPGVSGVQDLGQLVFGQAHTNDDGTKTRKHDLAKFLQRETPAGSIWYVKLAYQRLLLDQLKAAQDENYEASYAAIERRAQQDGQSFFWRPGASRPDRAPDFGSALRGPEPIDGSAVVN